MRKGALALAGVIVLAVAGAVGFAAWSGRVVAAELDAQTQKLALLSPIFKITENKLARGLFHSTRDVTLQLGCVPPGLRDGGAAVPILLHWHDDIQHGPLPGARAPAVARVASELRLPADVAERAKPYLGAGPPLKVQTTITLAGELQSTFEVARLQFTDPAQGSFATTPLRGSMRGPARAGADGTRSYTADIPSWEIDTRGPDGAHGAVHVDRTHYQVTMKPSADSSSWVQPMQTRGSIGKLELSGSAPAQTGLATLRAVFDALTFESDSSVEQGLWTNTSKVITKGKIGDLKVDALELASAMRRVHAATYQRFIGKVMAEALRCDAPPADRDAAFAESAHELTDLLLYDPEYALDNLAIELGGKRAELSYSVGTKGVSKSDLELPMVAVLATKGVLAARARVHVGLLQELARKIGTTDPTGDPAQMVAQLDAALDGFAAQGFVKREGDVVASAASFEQGTLKVNGVPLDLPVPLPVPPR